MTWLNRRRTLLATIVVASLPFLLFWRLWAPNPADRAYFVEGDLSSQYLPLRAYAATRLAAGELPLWSPYAFGGQPALADIQSAVLYPPNLVWSLARGADLSMVDLQLQAITHLAIAGLGTFALARRLARCPWASLASGVAFALGGYATSFPLQQLTIISTVAWLPWMLLALERLLAGGARHRLTRAGALAITVALTALAGHPQTAMLCLYATLGYGAWRWYWLRPVHCSTLAALGGLGLGLALAMPQLLPTLEFIRYSSRADLGFDAVSPGFGLHEGVALLYPGYFGGSPQYAGVLTLLLAAWAVARLPWRRTGYWVILGTTGLLLSFGNATFLSTLTYLFLPGFATSRNQERAILWLAFALAMLAGLGLAALLREAASNPWPRAARRFLPWATLAAVGVGLLLFAGTRLPASKDGINLFGGYLKQHVWIVLTLSLAWLLWRWRAQGWLSTTALGVACLAILAINLASVNARFHLGPPSPAITRPSAQAAATLVLSLAPGQRAATAGLMPEGPNAGLLYGFPDTTGNTPLRLAGIEALEREAPPWVVARLLAVAAVMLPEGSAPGPELEPAPADGFNRVVSPAAPVRLVYQARTMAAADQPASMGAPDYDPDSIALLAGPVPDLGTPSPGDAAAVVSWQPEEIVAQVRSVEPTLAALAEPWYPGWTATMDGRPAAILQRDSGLIGVLVPGGEYELRVTYRPTSLYLGVALAALGILAYGGALLLARRRPTETL